MLYITNTIMENYTFEEYKEESFNDNPQLKEIYEMELLNHFI